MRGLRPILMMLTVAACGSERSSGRGFVEDKPGATVPTAVLKAEVDSTVQGWRGFVLHLLVAERATEADTRSTLQKAIDSLARADTSLNFIRASAFMVDSVVPGVPDAPINPVMHAVWGPADSSIYGARQRRTVFRTNFTLVGRFATDTAGRSR